MLGIKAVASVAVPAVKRIIKQLRNGEITVLDVPEEFRDNADIAIFERKAGLRITHKRGFDIISEWADP